MTDSEQLAVFNQRLMDCKARLRAKQKLSAMIDETKRQLAKANESKKRTLARLQKEDMDVAAMQGMSLTALFCSLMGTKEDRLEKERQEALAAKLKHGQSLTDVEELTRELEQLQQQHASLSDVEVEHERVFKEKADYLSERGDDVAVRLIQMAEQLSDLASQKKELHEAIRAGELARSALDEVLSKLSSSANWGAVDMMGGGLMTTMIKHSKMDAAKEQARLAQQYLRQFKQELAEADKRLQLSLNVDGFTKFADYFFDGLIMDWIVQSKIANAKKECSSAHSLVVAAIHACRRRLDAIQTEARDLESKKQEVIESAN
ncbi:MAG: hypothetical protein AAF664_12330 [Planctomycetota bacterium]